MVSFRSKEEYLEVITNQIRCKRARGTVAEELEQHIEDQKAAYIAQGDKEPEAMVKALEQMGDPEEVGKQLDKIHRPHLEWKLLLPVLILCIAGIFLQLSLEKALSTTYIPNRFHLIRQVLFMAVGAALMCLIYFIDYTVIGKYSKIIWVLLLTGCMIYARTGQVINGGVRYLPSIFMLFMPLYGGIVYAYRKKGYPGIIKCILITIVTFLIEMGCVAQSNVSAGFLLSCLFMLSLAVQKNWFGTTKSKSLWMIWGWPFVLLIFNFLIGNQLFTAYQWERLTRWGSLLINPAGNEHGYQMNLARQTVFQAELFGKSAGFKLGYLPSLNTDYILTYVIGRYGLAVGFLLIAVFIFLFARLLRLSLKLKNSLGQLIGFGCSMVFITMGINYIVANLGFQVLAQVNLPFVSYGGASLIVNFIVMGIILSVFRNSNIIREKPYEQRYALHIGVDLEKIK